MGDLNVERYTEYLQRFRNPPVSRFLQVNTIDPIVKNIDELLLWFMGYFAQTFRNRAIIKGGMVLQLLNSPRATNDLDILFVPFTSKKKFYRN